MTSAFKQKYLERLRKTSHGRAEAELAEAELVRGIRALATANAEACILAAIKEALATCGDHTRYRWRVRRAKTA